jgi:putative Mg2+ transporter-C (MgtC) family protein
MESLSNINFISLADAAISLSTAFILGSLIGLERQYRQRTAGLRTNNVMAYVVSGIGFLGAGVIMREEGNIRGINTAATLWGSATVGVCAGADLILEALLATLFVLAANTLLRPVVSLINQ